MSSASIMYNGVEDAEGWPEKIAEAQRTKTYTICGKEEPRIRFGEEKEKWGIGQQPCRDCAVLRGQYHVLGCCVERCPVCGGQVFTCRCPYAVEAENGTA
jgi:hypothetical protein